METLQKAKILNAWIFFMGFSNFSISCYEVSKFFTGSEFDFDKIPILVVFGLLLLKPLIRFHDLKEFTEEKKLEFEKNVNIIISMLIIGIILILTLLLRIFSSDI